MAPQDFKLLVITPEKDVFKEADWVNKLFAAGLSTLHLRKPGQSSQQLIQYLGKVEERYHGRIMVHYEEKVLQEIAVKGIHYRYGALPLEKQGYCLSCGCHSWEELKRVEKRVDYAFISPFFNSISKAGYHGQKELWEIPDGSPTSKAIALGGVNPGNIRQVMMLKIKGAAVLGAIWRAEDPVKAFLNFESRIRG